MNTAVAQKEDARLSGTELYNEYKSLKAAEPTLRARDASQKLGISEGELLASRVGTEDTAICLENSPEKIQECLIAVKDLGEVMALTRNESCVHERKGVYDNGSFEKTPHMTIGLFVNPDIDLRLFMNHWAFAFAATEQTRGGPKKSLQFFSKDGVAVHKIYLTDKSDEAAYDKLVENFKAEEQSNAIEIEEYAAKKPDMPDDQIDLEGFTKGWEALQDTHDFYPLLMKYRVGREQALRIVKDDLAYQIDNNASRELLNLAKESNCEIMVFVGSRGCIQIHTGPVNKLLEHGTWYNVMDPKFNLHLNEEKISSTWVTKKPTEDGIVTAVEVFDEDKELIATFFGKRKPGIPELEAWREVVSKLK